MQQTINQRTPEWFLARRGKITASNAGAILGLNKHRSADDVMRSMVREHFGLESEFKGNIATDYGTRNESNAIEEFEIENLVSVQECGFFSNNDWLGGSPDGLIGDNAIVEVKCPFGRRNDKDTSKFLTIEEQPHYFAQIQICLAVTKREMCHFIQWCPYGGMTVERVFIDWKWLNRNVKKLKEFHNRFLEEIKKKDSKYFDSREKIDYGMCELAQEYQELKFKIQEMKERQNEIIDALRIIAHDKPAKFGELSLIKVERKGSVQYSKAVNDMLPDADLEKYRGKPSVSWSLR